MIKENSDLLLQRLLVQIKKSLDTPFYRKKLKNIKVSDIKTIDDFQKIPFTTKEEIAEEFRSNPPYGGFLRPDIVRINFTPMPGIGMMPLLYTRNDIIERTKGMADWLHNVAGIETEDVVQIFFNYSRLPAALMFHESCEAVGAKVIPMGPGDAEEQNNVIHALGTTVLIGNASFGLKIAEKRSVSLRVFIAAGEPFSTISGRRDQLIKAFGGNTIALDYYGSAEIGRTAAECPEMDGMHIFNDYIFVELIDPETGELVPEGTQGELVLTHLQREAMPLLRFRTSDLSMLVRKPCKCGKEWTLPKGILGRCDEMHKVKGVKLYPSQIALILAGIKGLSPGKYRVSIGRRTGFSDFLELEIEGNVTEVNVHDLTVQLKSQLGISPNSIKIVERLSDGPKVVDEYLD